MGQEGAGAELAEQGVRHGLHDSFSQIYHHIENGKHCDDLEDQYYKNQVEEGEFSDF